MSWFMKTAQVCAVLTSAIVIASPFAGAVERSQIDNHGVGDRPTNHHAAVLKLQRQDAENRRLPFRLAQSTPVDKHLEMIPRVFEKGLDSSLVDEGCQRIAVEAGETLVDELKNKKMTRAQNDELFDILQELGKARNRCKVRGRQLMKEFSETAVRAYGQCISSKCGQLEPSKQGYCIKNANCKRPEMPSWTPKKEILGSVAQRVLKLARELGIDPNQ